MVKATSQMLHLRCSLEESTQLPGSMSSLWRSLGNWEEGGGAGGKSGKLGFKEFGGGEFEEDAAEVELLRVRPFLCPVLFERPRLRCSSGPAFRRRRLRITPPFGLRP